MLARISNEMVKAQKQYFGRGPTKAKAYMLDDFLIIVMRGGLTQAEKSMLVFDQADKVRDFRQAFENEMTGRLTTMIEEMTGRKVLTYQSQILFDPDVVFEIFMFDEVAREDQVRETAEGQLSRPSLGEASDELTE
ncbi:MAG: DUF2294 domain-containing protein [Actinomycetota bacterium]|nr:DUF2294 domain-containing protein [Actinomycetota bacterium]